MVLSVGSITTVLTCLSTVASAVPIAQSRKGFTLKQRSVEATAPRFVDFPGVYAGAFSKYGANVPDGIKAAAANGTAVAKPEKNDKEYLTPVTVGDTVLNLDIDTGSADLWVFSNELPPQERGQHSIYKPSSGGKKMEGYSWKISYGDGSSANGNVWKDTVTVGGVTAQDQAIEAAQAISQQFTKDKNNDGLLGLGFSKINTVKPESQKTFIDTVKDNLDSPVFAVSLKHNAPGSYDFGHIDESKYTGSLKYIDVDSSEGYWMFTTSGFSVGNGQVQSTPIRGIADTGTTLLMLPSDVVEAYYKQIPGAQQNPTAGGYAVPCDAEMPSFTVELGGGISLGGSATVPFPRVSASAPVSTPTVSVAGAGSIPYGNYGSGSGSGSGLGTTFYGNGGNSMINSRSTTPGIGASSPSQGTYKAVTPGKYLKMSPVMEGGSTCFGGMQSNDGMDFSIFGDVFLKNQYVVFDMNGPRLGFAPQAD